MSLTQAWVELSPSQALPGEALKSRGRSAILARPSTSSYPVSSSSVFRGASRHSPRAPAPVLSLQSFDTNFAVPLPVPPTPPPPPCVIVHVCVWPLALPAALAEVFPAHLAPRDRAHIHPVLLPRLLALPPPSELHLLGLPSSSWLCQSHTNQWEWPQPMQHLFWLPVPSSQGGGDVGSPDRGARIWLRWGCAF